MAIRWRRGNYIDLDLGKLVPGEPVVALDNKYVAVCIKPGEVVELASREYMEEALEIANQYADEAEKHKNSAYESLQSALDSADAAEQNAQEANDKAILAKSYSEGGTGKRPGEDTDNSKYYSEESRKEADRAKEEADRASSVVDVGIATVERPGIVSPDGKTTVVNSAGVISTKHFSMIPITEGSDLNNYDEPGFYRCLSNVIAAGLINSPTNKAFFMEVGKHATTGEGTDGYYQEITEYLTENPKKYMRNIHNGVAGQWYEIYTQASPPPTVNNLLATVSGNPLDATMGKALDDKIVEINKKLISSSGKASKGEKFKEGGVINYLVKNGICFVSMELTPLSPLANGDLVAHGLPTPYTDIYMTIPAASSKLGGINYPSILRRNGEIKIYYPANTETGRIDYTFSYPVDSNL